MKFLRNSLAIIALAWTFSVSLSNSFATERQAFLNSNFSKGKIAGLTWPADNKPFAIVTHLNTEWVILQGTFIRPEWTLLWVYKKKQQVIDLHPDGSFELKFPLDSTKVDKNVIVDFLAIGPMGKLNKQSIALVLKGTNSAGAALKQKKNGASRPALGLHGNRIVNPV